MITKIIMKDIASYKKEALFLTDKKTNLIYGLNGTGKSTLSSFLYSINNPKYDKCKVEGLLNTDKLLVYNQQFIQDNFYETEDIHGIFTLSKENKAVKTIIDDAKNNIKTLLTQKLKLDTDANNLLLKYQKQKDEYEKEVWKIKTEYSGGDRVLEYCLEGLKGKKEVLFQHIVSLDMPAIKLTYSVEDLKRDAIALQGDAKKVLTVTKIQFDVSMIENSTLLAKVIVGNKESSVSELIEKMKNSDWVNQGLQFVHMEDGQAICPFCQQKTITDVFLKEIEGYFDESYQKDKDRIIELLEKYEDITKNEFLNIQNFKQNEFFTKYNKDLDICLAEITKVTTENIHRLKKKVEMPSMIVSLEKIDEIVGKINVLIDKVNVEIREYNEKIDNKQKSLNDIKEKFWKIMRFDYDAIINLYRTTEKDYKVASSEMQINLQKKQDDIKVQQKIVDENSKKTVNIDEAVENIKKGLIDIGISDFTIEKHSDEEALYHLKRENSNSNVFKTLSEGEKMVISFLYFIELCKGETKTEAISTGKIIVIDDPISSLSHIYIFNIGRLIHNEFLRTEKYEQIFVLTHSLYFFYELTCINHDERKKLQKLYRLCKNSEGSSFIEMKYEEIQNDYQAYWQIIKDNTQSPALIANCMRNIMEYFFNFVEKQDFAQVFQRPELQEIRFAAFNRYMNRESHSKGQNIFDIKEFDYDSFREAFKLVFEIEGYRLHYMKMIK
ncbi:AAA family ATPase [Anaerocolumna sp. AGMB13025]|uniref:AAA family ATPase n=1 Tax=Anaerocolumna sp. AGMB13025 TaxID=3039116 RepID=UPI00241C9ED6|nr:AAA family ATPase [Anaerocolumna sp. AGMB13025]WFR58803.1 AAA family ATPase [Anaerocolumna sp. AGMB13025]